MQTLDQSEKLYSRGVHSVPRGTHSDSRCRVPHPRYFARAQGAWVFDADGNRYLDCIMGNGAVILGHSHLGVSRKVLQQIETGLGAGLEGELSIVAAEQFLSQIPTAERVRFTNTGTEASMHAIAMARAHTGKNDIAKPEGSYHGWTDFIFVSSFPDTRRAGDPACPTSVAGSAGLHPAAVASTLVVPFNDIENTEVLLRRNADRLAAIILEPILIDVGWVPARKEYLQKLRNLTRELGIVLIFDELLTGFRLIQGSAQKFYEVTPDLSIFGKALGNGYMIAAVAGRADLMVPDQSTTVGYTFLGTFNSHQTSLAACSAVLEVMSDGAVVRQLDERTRYIIQEFNGIAKKFGVAARMVGGGGHFHWYFAETEPTNYREVLNADAMAYQVFSRCLSQNGILCAPNYIQHHAISAAHGDSETEFLLAAMRVGLSEVAKSK